MADLPTDCATWDAALGLHALGALHDWEARGMREHLSRCPDCTQRLEALQAAADALPFAVPPASPSAVVREQVLRRASPPVRPARRPWSRRVAVPAWAAAVAAALLLGVNGAWLGVALSQRAAMERQEARISGLEQRAAAPGLRVPARGPDTRVVTLKGGAGAPDAVGELAYDSASSQVAIVLHRLPPLLAGQAYQSWLRQGGAWISIGLLAADGRGDGLMIVALPAGLAAYDGYWLSREPAGGSVQPSPGATVVRARLST